MIGLDRPEVALEVDGVVGRLGLDATRERLALSLGLRVLVTRGELRPSASEALLVLTEGRPRTPVDPPPLRRLLVELGWGLAVRRLLARLLAAVVLVHRHEVRREVVAEMVGLWHFIVRPRVLMVVGVLDCGLSVAFAGPLRRVPAATALAGLRI